MSPIKEREKVYLKGVHIWLYIKWHFVPLLLEAKKKTVSCLVFCKGKFEKKREEIQKCWKKSYSKGLKCLKRNIAVFFFFEEKSNKKLSNKISENNKVVSQIIFN